MVLFCFIAAILLGLGIFWGLPSIQTPASDSPAPLSPLNWIARYRDTSVSYIYPPVHQLVCLAAYAVVLLGWKVAGGISAITKTYPYGFHNPVMVFSSLLFVTNLLSLVMGVAVLLFMRSFRIARSADAWYSVCLLGLGGIFPYYARVGNLDVPYLFWVMISWVLVWRYVFSRADAKLLVFAGIAGALAIGSKDQSIGIEFGLGLTVLLVSVEGSLPAIAQRIKAGLWFGSSLFAAYFVSAVAVNPWRWWAHIRFVTSDHVLPEYPASVAGQVHVFLRSIVRISHILSPVGLALGVFGVALLLARRKWRITAVLFLPPAAYYVSIIMRVRSTEERYLLSVAIALAIAAGFAAGELLAWTRGSRVARSLVMVLLAAILVDQVVEGFIPVTYCQLHDVRLELAGDLPSLVPPGSALLMVRMNGFNVPDSRVYERYRLMLPPDKKLLPPSTHSEHMLSAYDPQYRYVLAGSTRTDEAWPPVGKLVREWKYPEWISSRVHVPAIYEFALYERSN